MSRRARAAVVALRACVPPRADATKPFARRHARGIEHQRMAASHGAVRARARRRNDAALGHRCVERAHDSGVPRLRRRAGRASQSAQDRHDGHALSARSRSARADGA